MSTEALLLLLGERHLQQTSNCRELISRLQRTAHQRLPAPQSESASTNSSVPHAELAALIASIVDERMNRHSFQDGGASNAPLARPSPRPTSKRALGPVLLHCRKMAANLTRPVNNFFSFTILHMVISSQTPLFLQVSPPFLPPSTFAILLKSRRFTRTSDSLPSPAI